MDNLHSLREDLNLQSKYGRAYLGFTHPSLRPPYKSYEYESIDDSNKRLDWEHGHSPFTSYGTGGGGLRETAITSVLDNDTNSRFAYRRYSDGFDVKRRLDPSSYRKPKSWQPSPYDSDEDDELLSREEKKAKIKAEIARRRQQIEENARLHDELLRLSSHTLIPGRTKNY
ncbi:hypothetical protein M8J75_000932 [Diaphorina citri]|nr:hypothetical protein M8J75_000932 [Diaphorina citri]